MKTLLAYASKHGTTRKAAEKLAGQLEGEVKIINLKERASRNVRIEDYERVIVGGSIHIGKIQKSVRKFCQANLEKLLEVKQLGLFICCAEEKEKALEQMQNAFPAELLEKAAAKGLFGHEFNLEKMSFISRAMIKKVAEVEKSESKIKDENIKQFAEDLV